MNHFKEALDLLRGFVFADKESEANALWLRHFIVTAAASSYGFRAPLVVITGPPACGKTCLVRSVCRDLEDGDVITTMTLGSDVLSFAARQRAVMLVNEDRRAVKSEEVARFVTATTWASKAYEPRLKRQKLRHIVLRTVVIVTGSPSLKLSADLQRRSLFIRLASRDA